MEERRTEYMRLGDLVPNPRNPKRHAIDGIRASIQRFGFIDNATIDERDGTLISGHGRTRTLAEARQAGLEAPGGVRVAPDGEWLIPVNRGWQSRDDAEQRAALIALNRQVELGGWDDGLLAGILAELRDSVPDDPLAGLDGTGFSIDDLTAMLDRLDSHPYGPVKDPDAAPPLPAKPRSEAGQTWHLGKHRLHIGDARDPAALAAALDGATADMVWTDPPYGVDYVGKTADALTMDNDAGAGLAALLGAAFPVAAQACRPGAVWIVAAPAGPQMAAFVEVLSNLGIWRQTLVWVKNIFVMGHSDYHYRHELLFYGWVPGAAHHLPPDRTYDSVFAIDRPSRSEEHPTMKPVELVARGVRTHSAPGEIVLDPFAGSGSTLIACQQNGRASRLVEIDPRYADVILRRWQQFTGVKPLLNGEAPHDFG